MLLPRCWYPVMLQYRIVGKRSRESTNLSLAWKQGKKKSWPPCVSEKEFPNIPRILVVCVHTVYNLRRINAARNMVISCVSLTKMDSRSMCAAHILRSTQHTCRVHMCTNCTRAYKIRAACICFVCVHIVTMQTYASCMCANCTLYAHFILCTDSRTLIKVSVIFIYLLSSQKLYTTTSSIWNHQIQLIYTSLVL